MSEGNQGFDQTLQAPYPSNEDGLLTPKIRDLITDASKFVRRRIASPGVAVTPDREALSPKPAVYGVP
jgi:hypothetical protein